MSTEIDTLVAKYKAQAIKQNKETDLYRRILLVGDSGAGKTYSSITTIPPEIPIILADVDDGLAGVPPRDSLIRFDFSNLDSARTLVQSVLEKGDNIRCVFDCVRVFITRMLKSIVNDFKGNCIFMMDSVSTLGDTLMETLESDPQTITNKFYLWGEWASEWRDLSTAIKMLRCNVIVTAHEQPEYETVNNQQRLVQYIWYLPGNAFSPRFAQFFTDALLQRREVKLVTVNSDKLAFPDATLSGKVPEVEYKYFWQLQPEKMRPWIKTRSTCRNLWIPAGWQSLLNSDKQPQPTMKKV